MFSLNEIILLMMPSAVIVISAIAVLIILATRRTDTSEYKRLSERVRLLEADHHADLAQITNFREEVFYLGRLISLLAELIEESGLELPAEVDNYLRRRNISRPMPIEPNSAILIQHALQQFFDIEELQQLSFEIGIDFDNLPGGTKERKARELVLFVDRRGQLEMLVEMIRIMRPNVPLPWLGARGPPE